MPRRRNTIRTRRLLTTAALLVGISATAHAGTLSTGALYGGASQHSALCGFFNAGTAITITAAELVDFFGGNIVDQNNCQVTPLGPGDSCYFSGNPIPSGPEGSEGTVSCQVTTNAPVGKLRGVLTIRDSSGKVLATSDLR